MNIVAKELRPLDRFRLHGVVWECERQARRTTIARAISSQWDGVRIQLKRDRIVEKSQ